jgi:hypothetical protein
MMKITGNSLPYHHHAPWPLRKVIVLVAGISLAVWGLALTAILG